MTTKRCQENLPNSHAVTSIFSQNSSIICLFLRCNSSFCCSNTLPSWAATWTSFSTTSCASAVSGWWVLKISASLSGKNSLSGWTSSLDIADPLQHISITEASDCMSEPSNIAILHSTLTTLSATEFNQSITIHCHQENLNYSTNQKIHYSTYAAFSPYSKILCVICIVKWTECECQFERECVRVSYFPPYFSRWVLESVWRTDRSDMERTRIS